MSSTSTEPTAQAGTITVPLRELCGVRSGDKGNISDLTVFADDDETYALLVEQVSAQRVKEHFGRVNAGEVVRYLAPNVLAIKFVLTEALGGGGSLSLRSDMLGKTLGGALLRLPVDVPRELAERCGRYLRRAPLEESR